MELSLMLIEQIMVMVIMALAGFNYLALVYQNFDSKECVQERRLMRRTPRETKRHYMKVWVAMDVCCEA